MAARMVPALSEERLLQIKSRAEAKFYRACRDQLGPDTLVLHSIPWISTVLGSRPRNGETDFTIFDPAKGFLVVEVKGGGIRFSPSMGKWFSIDEHEVKHELDEDPFIQALREEKATLEQIRGSQKWKALGSPFLPGGHAVCFPDVDDLQIFIELSHTRKEILAGRSQLNHLIEWVHSVFGFWEGERSRKSALPPNWMNVIEDIFCMDREVRPWLSARLDEIEKTRINLTEEQANRLRLLGRRKRAAICGGAGTGKTLLAVEKARQLAQEGKRTLLVCYNQLLGSEFSKLMRESPDLVATNFHQLCFLLADKSKTEIHHDVIQEAIDNYRYKDEYDVQLPYALMLSALDFPDYRFDAMVVDEGQDFLDDYWTALSFLLRDEKESSLFIFFDSNQALYQRSPKFPIKDEPYPLYKNCRNTKKIHEAVYRYYTGDPVEPPDALGFDIGCISAKSHTEQATQLVLHLREILSNDKNLQANNFVILIGDNYNKRSYYSELQNNQRHLPPGYKFGFEQHESKWHIPVDTVHRFKGLEAPIVFLWGVDNLNIEDEDEILYVAMSRAKSMLYIISTEQRCKKVLSAHL